LLKDVVNRQKPDEAGTEKPSYVESKMEGKPGENELVALNKSEEINEEFIDRDKVNNIGENRPESSSKAGDNVDSD
jgi:hypothetical protein